ncbi:MAG: Serine/threonine protein kinase [Massilia sp.]|nr:Serine/threonine protein kinase [Massilia sp.]
MTRHLHESANAVLYRALDLPSGDRQQFIAQATAGDLELFEDVRTMLSRIEQLDQFLEDPLELPVEQKAPAPVLPRHGDLIGDWRVEQELGRNGADLIVLVRRAGAGAASAHDRFGTMRLAQAASRGGQTATRFERLRERLAALDHPAIPRPVDAGSTADGRPYFVVDRRVGEPIDRYCAAEHLDLAARAKLFAKFCDAVHYMHQHLIVHRDLKPADMLVAPNGAVTLLDVGMIGDGWPVDPAYASPDQLAGQPLSVSSDVYSLGAVLYTLLSGRYAHGVDAGGVFKTAGGAPVTAPSRAVLDALEQGAGAPADLPGDALIAPATALADQLRRCFDAILLRALAPDPAARHPSAHALARELEQAAACLQAPLAPVPAPAVADAAIEDEHAAPIDTIDTIDTIDNVQDPLEPASVTSAPTAPTPPLRESVPLAPSAPPRSPVPLALAMLVTGLLAGAAAGVFGGPWLRQQGLITTPAVSTAPPAATPSGVAAGRPLRTGAAVQPNLPAALALADSRRAAGDLAGARQAAEQALELTAGVPQSSRDQASADAYLRLGAILAEQGDTAQGLLALRKALALREAHAVMENGAEGGNGSNGSSAGGSAHAARAAADVHRAIAEVLAGTGDDAGAEVELAAARTVYATQLKQTPADAALHTGLLSIELALAASQNAQKHGRDTIRALADLRRLAGAGGDPRIDLLEAYVQPRGTPAQANAAARPALVKIRHANSDHPDASQTRALARALTMAGEIGQRARQGAAACADFAEAAQLYAGLGGANRLNAYDKRAVERLNGLMQACK